MEFQEIISEFFNSPQMKQMIAGFIAYLTANLGTIILFGVKYAKAKSAEIKNKIAAENEKLQLKQEYDDRFNQVCSYIDSKLDKIESLVIEKLDTNEAERKAEIQKNTVQIQEAVDAMKKSLDTDEIINS